MPVTVHRTYDKLKPSDEMMMKMRRYIIRERARRKQEIAEGAALINKRKEQKRQDEEDSHSLEQIRVQIRDLEDKCENLREEKHKLFGELKKVLNQEEEDKRLARQREQEEAERRRNDVNAARNSQALFATSNYLHPSIIALPSLYGTALNTAAFTAIPTGQLSFPGAATQLSLSGQLGLGGHGQSAQMLSSQHGQHAQLGLAGMQNTVGQLGLVGQGQLDLVSQQSLGLVGQSAHVSQQSMPTSSQSNASHSAAASMRTQAQSQAAQTAGHLLVSTPHGAHLAQSSQQYPMLGLPRPSSDSRQPTTIFQPVPLLQLSGGNSRQTLILPLQQTNAQAQSMMDEHAAKRPKTDSQASGPQSRGPQYSQPPSQSQQSRAQAPQRVFQSDTSPPRLAAPQPQNQQQPCSLFPFFAAPIRSGLLGAQTPTGQPVQHQYVSSTSQQSRAPTNGSLPQGPGSVRYTNANPPPGSYK